MSRTTSGPDDHTSQPLLTLRTALILLLAVLAGLSAGALGLWAGRHIAEAVLLGLGVAAGAAAFFNWLIGPR
jgi:hypothetical protein